MRLSLDTAYRIRRFDFICILQSGPSSLSNSFICFCVLRDSQIKESFFAVKTELNHLSSREDFTRVRICFADAWTILTQSDWFRCTPYAYSYDPICHSEMYRNIIRQWGGTNKVEVAVVCPQPPLPQAQCEALPGCLPGRHELFIVLYPSFN